jgi:hypothetical protein
MNRLSNFGVKQLTSIYNVTLMRKNKKCGQVIIDTLKQKKCLCSCNVQFWLKNCYINKSVVLLTGNIRNQGWIELGLCTKFEKTTKSVKTHHWHANSGTHKIAISFGHFCLQSNTTVHRPHKKRQLSSNGWLAKQSHLE